MDDEWKEYKVHEQTIPHHDDQATNQVVDDDDQENDIVNRDVVFKMFQTKDEDEDIVTEEYKFPQLDHTIILRGASEITNSTGLGLWRGAEVLASFLASHPDMVRDKCVLELGAGQGLCGLVAHHVGASKVLLTDGDTAVLKNLRYNVNLNTTTKESGRNNDKCSSSSSSSSSNNNNMVSCPQFIWGRNTSDFLKTYNDGKKFHVLLATDVNYMVSSLKPFWTTASEALEPVHGILLYANVSASQCSMDTILSFAKEYGFEWESPALDVYMFCLVGMS